MTTAERTHPELWEKVKHEFMQSSKGGDQGEWSARKAQLAVQEYKKRGGGYKGEQSEDNHLKEWTEEEWGTKSGKRSKDTGERYLPKKARDALSDEEYRRTSQKKQADMRRGKQYSDQPDDIAKKTAKFRETGGEPTKAELAERAAELQIGGRSSMTKDELREAIARAEDAEARRQAMTKADLLEIAKMLGAVGRQSHTKAEIANSIAERIGVERDTLRKADLTESAGMLDIGGRSKMNKDELCDAIAQALKG